MFPYLISFAKQTNKTLPLNQPFTHCSKICWENCQAIWYPEQWAGPKTNISTQACRAFSRWAESQCAVPEHSLLQKRHSCTVKAPTSPYHKSSHRLFKIYVSLLPLSTYDQSCLWLYPSPISKLKINLTNNKFLITGSPGYAWGIGSRTPHPHPTDTKIPRMLKSLL